LAYIGLIDRVSIRLASLAAQSALLCPSFEIARQTLQHHGIELVCKTIQRICRAIGQKAMGHRHAIVLDTHENADGRVVLVCIDGGRIRERKTKRGRRPAGQKRLGNSKAGSNAWRNKYLIIKMRPLWVPPKAFASDADIFFNWNMIDCLQSLRSSYR
jgi:hypothetical protein